MPLPSSGAISLNDVNVELGNAGTTQISMNDAAVRTLFQVASGAISMSDGYGKSNAYTATITSNQVNLNLRSYAVTDGWDESSALKVTLDSGVYISSSTTGGPALTISGSFPGGVEFINNGIVAGRGGNGGQGGYTGSLNAAGSNGYGGASGGGALSVSSNVTIDNTNGIIAGGGGGGGGGGSGWGVGYECYDSHGGGGGGGGRSNISYYASGGGSGGYGAGGGGTGTHNAAGNAGTAYAAYRNCTGFYLVGGVGGAGGAWGSSGSTGALGRGYGGHANSFYAVRNGGAGASAGYCVSGDSYITWTATGTRYGTIS